VPKLAIVSPRDWLAVQDIVAQRDPLQGADARQRRPVRPYLLSRKVFCRCGAPMKLAAYAIPSGHTERPLVLRCSAREIAKCQEPSVRLHRVENLVARMILDNISGADFERVYVGAYNEQVEREAAELKRKWDIREREVKRLDRELRNLRKPQVTDGFSERSIAEWRAELEADLQKARDALARVPSPRSLLTLDRVGATNLREALSGLSATSPFRAVDERGFDALALFHALVSKVILTPGPGQQDFSVVVEGHVAELFGAEPEPGNAFQLFGEFKAPIGEVRRLDEARVAEIEDEKGTFRLTDEVWAEMERRLVGAQPRTGAKRTDWLANLRRCLDAMLLVANVRTLWRRLPERYRCSPEPHQFIARMRSKNREDWTIICDVLREMAPHLIERTNRRFLAPARRYSPTRGGGRRRRVETAPLTAA
jgi:hypothetical protein